jgi:radical SAM superfamily enzyme YgiQ (UPF0313 family)
MKIALLDLSHIVRTHTVTVTLGIGLISKYVSMNVSGCDIKLFKDHRKLLQTLNDWIPDIVGISQYSWNSELNYYMARYIHELNPNCLIVAGGPNLPLGTKEKYNFFKEKELIDICIPFDGEIPFLNIVKEWLTGKTVDEIKDIKLPGTYSVKNNILLESNNPPPKLESLDVFGPIYAEGLFNEMLDDGWQPFLQTQRGCPNKCAYCHTGLEYYTKILFQSPEVFKEDLEYLAKKYQNREDIMLYLANPNFSLFKRDFEIASIIREMQDKYNWPQKINSNYGNNRENLLKVYNMLKYKIIPSLALQTLSKEVLNNINRKNIDFDKYVEFQDMMRKDYGSETSSELILNLPGESKESFLDTISQVLNTKVQSIYMFTLMLLPGTLLATDEYIKKYSQKYKYRLNYDSFSEIKGDKIFDIEIIVVENSTMSYDDYLFFRKLALLMEIFASSKELFNYRVKLIDEKRDVMKYLLYIYDNIHKYKVLSDLVDDFERETESELFNTQEELNEFYNNNYDKLLSGELGQNLLRKYRTIVRNNYIEECKEIINGYNI